LPETEGEKAQFDFDAHRRVAIDQYAKIRPVYVDFAGVVRSILNESILRKSLKVHSVEARAKSLEQFGEKAMKPSVTNPNLPMYRHPLKEITDLAGARVIAFFPRTVDEVDKCIREQFEIVEQMDLGAVLRVEDRLGYQSVHYVVRLTPARIGLPEYSRFAGLVGEIQVRTVLQHAWAEIEHDIQYKSSATIPSAIRRRFISLAGLLEIADREFQAIQDEDVALRTQARASVKQGFLKNVETTPDALRAYLDLKLGPDARMSDFSYEWTARLLKKLGFENLAQIDECISDYDDDVVSRAVTGGRQGQLSRLEYMLLAGMGEGFILGHTWAAEEWFKTTKRVELEKLRQAGIKVGSFNPASHHTNSISRTS